MMVYGMVQYGVVWYDIVQGTPSGKIINIQLKENILPC